MGVPWIRAVLRAAFAARRKARPTAAANFSVSFFTLVRFMDLFLKYEDCDQSYHTRSKRREKPVKLFEVIPAPIEAPEHVGTRDIMPALLYSSRDAAECQSRRRETQVDNFNAITSCFPTFQTAKIHQPAQRALEGKVQACLGEAIRAPLGKAAPRQQRPLRGAMERAHSESGRRSRNEPP